MITCKDCIHYDVCNFHIDEETELTVLECSHFKNKADYAETRHGKWLKKRNMYECSKCSNTVFATGISGFNYCHGCGAKMTRTPKERGGEK